MLYQQSLHSNRRLDISNVALSVGETLDTLSVAEGYNGEKAVKSVSTVKAKNSGVLFGGKLPVFVDYLTFILIIIALIATVSLPIYFKYRKTKNIIAKKK